MKSLQARIEDAKAAFVAAELHRDHLLRQADELTAQSTRIRHLVVICEDGINQIQERIAALEEELLKEPK